MMASGMMPEYALVNVKELALLLFPVIVISINYEW